VVNLLFFVQMGASYGLVLGFTALFGGGQVFIKIVVDLILSLCSYQVQMRWVFKKKKEKKKKKAGGETVA
jgi:membrane protein implicated in regulation of membrane protease activity